MQPGYLKIDLRIRDKKDGSSHENFQQEPKEHRQSKI